MPGEHVWTKIVRLVWCGKESARDKAASWLPAFATPQPSLSERRLIWKENTESLNTLVQLAVSGFHSVAMCQLVATRMSKAPPKGTTGISRLFKMSVKWLCTSHVPGVSQPLLCLTFITAIHCTYNGLRSLWDQDLPTAHLQDFHCY